MESYLPSSYQIELGAVGFAIHYANKFEQLFLDLESLGTRIFNLRQAGLDTTSDETALAVLQDFLNKPTVDKFIVSKSYGEEAFEPRAVEPATNRQVHDLYCAAYFGKFRVEKQ